MKISRWMLAVAVLGLISTVASADSIDPKGKLVGGGGSTGLFTLTDVNFNGTVFGDGSSKASFDFINLTGILVGEVDLLITNDSQDTLSFSADPSNHYFTSASPITPVSVAGGGGTVLMKFFGLNPDAGLNGLPFSTDFSCGEGEFNTNCTDYSHNGSDFSVQFDVTDLSRLGLSPDQATFDFKGTLVAAPEPPTVVVLLAGAGLLLLLKRLW
jgi:hypothetical protein